MFLLIFLISYTEIIPTSYELKYSEMLMMININHLLELLCLWNTIIKNLRFQHNLILHWEKPDRIEYPEQNKYLT